MPKRIDKLTPEQMARMDEWADRWIDIGLCTDPADWQRWEEGARRCYEAAGIPWPGVVVRVSSPLVMALAGPAAALAVELIERNGAVAGAVAGAVGGAVDDAVRGAVRGAVGGATNDEVHRAVHDAVSAAADGAVGDAVAGAVGGAVDDAVRGAVAGAVGGAVDDAVRGAVAGAVAGAVGGAVDDAVRGAVRGAVGGATNDEVHRAVHDAVSAAADGAVGDAVRQSWWRYLGGGSYWAYWTAWSSYFREVAALELGGDLWDRARAYEQTQESAWSWWPHRRFVMVCDRPTTIHREQVGTRGWGSHRLHNDRGPAVAFRDGWAVWAIHGVRVTEQIVMRPETLTPQQIMAIDNAEVRRVAIERYGWDKFVGAAGLKLVDECADPANAPHILALYNAPADLLGFDARVLLCVNASPERDGTVRRFGLTVPADVDSALAAAAWTFGLDAETYRALERAS